MDFKVYDAIGWPEVGSDGHIRLQAIVFLPLIEDNGEFRKLEVTHADPIVITRTNEQDTFHIGILLVIKFEGITQGQRDEPVRDYYPVDISIQVPESDLTEDIQIRLLVKHNNTYVDNGVDSSLVECTTRYIENIMNGEVLDFTGHVATFCEVDRSRPASSGGGKMPSI